MSPGRRESLRRAGALALAATRLPARTVPDAARGLGAGAALVPAAAV
ncbi:MAG: hypothetical protein RJA99_4735, partial [Pseudomonadota bacterium]